jgi:hypothetical protein
MRYAKEIHEYASFERSGHLRRPRVLCFLVFMCNVSAGTEAFVRPRK